MAPLVTDLVDRIWVSWPELLEGARAVRKASKKQLEAALERLQVVLSDR
jgi:hypothetical protein